MPSFARAPEYSSRLAKAHRRCRVCGEEIGQPYLHLGNQPLPNAFVETPEIDYELRYPLTVHFCRQCGLSQLSMVVDPQMLYGTYKFTSGASPAWHTHAEQFAASQGDGAGRFMVDIAANDGTQAFYFQERGWRVLGVDPSPVASSVPMVRRFFNQSVAEDIVAEHGHADLIVAQNVLAHVDDVIGFLDGVYDLLADGGRCAIEVPHVRDLITNGEFDTIYHEHLSYWNTSALVVAASRARLALDQVEVLKTHGGSRRYWLTRKPTVQPFKHQSSAAPLDERPYLQFAMDVERRLTDTKQVLESIKADGKRLWAFGASAKGTVMLNALQAHGNEVWPEAILDDTPGKQGLFSPGLHLPIYSPVWMQQPNTENVVLWLLSWNWAPALMERAKSLGFKGQFLVTSPRIEVL